MREWDVPGIPAPSLQVQVQHPARLCGRKLEQWRWQQLRLWTEWRWWRLRIQRGIQSWIQLRVQPGIQPGSLARSSQVLEPRPHISPSQAGGCGRLGGTCGGGGGAGAASPDLVVASRPGEAEEEVLPTNPPSE